MAAFKVSDDLGLPPLHAEQIGRARHVDIEESAAHQEVGRLGRHVLGELGEPLRGDHSGQPALPTPAHQVGHRAQRSEEHTSELQSLMRISYAVFCLKKKKQTKYKKTHN